MIPQNSGILPLSGPIEMFNPNTIGAGAKAKRFARTPLALRLNVDASAVGRRRYERCFDFRRRRSHQTVNVRNRMPPDDNQIRSRLRPDVSSSLLLNKGLSALRTTSRK